MLNINNRVFIDIVINGVSLPFDKISFHELLMHESEMFLYPCATLVIGDAVDYFKEKPIPDGALVTIKTGRFLEQSFNKTFSWRVFNVRPRADGASTTYVVNMVLNSPKFVNENSKASYNGRVSEVLEEICYNTALTPNIDQTSDSQVWYPAGKIRSTFVKDITQYAYLNPQSCFVSGVTMEGELRLKNLSNLNFEGANVLLVRGTAGDSTAYSVLDRKELIESGFQNSIAGYRKETVVQSDSGVSTEREVTVAAKSNTINMNATLSERLEGSRMEISPVDSGNTHPNYYVAKHQNQRSRATYGMGLFIMSDQELPLNLFDVCKYIDFDSANSKVSLNPSVSGSFFVSAKTIKVTPGFYFEKLKLLRQGLNADMITEANLNVIGVS